MHRSTDNSFFIINHPSFMGNLNYSNDTVMIPFVTSFVNVIFQIWRGFPEKNAPGMDFRERRCLISFVSTVQASQRWIRPEPSPPASFSTSATVTML